MKKFIMCFGLLALSANALASSHMAFFNVVDNMEKLIIVNKAIKPGKEAQSHLIALKMSKELTGQIDKQIANGLNQGLSCEVITAALTTNLYNPGIKDLQFVNSAVADRVTENTVASLAVYTMERCNEF